MEQMQMPPRERMVSQFMTVNPITVGLNSSVMDVVGLLSTAGVRHIPVVEDGRLIGIVSDRDIRSIAGDYLQMPAEQTTKRLPRVADFCETDVLTVSPDDDIIDVIDLMLSHTIGALPVVQQWDQKLVGMVSYVDVLREIRKIIR